MGLWLDRLARVTERLYPERERGAKGTPSGEEYY